MKISRKYKKPPIVEVTCEFRFKVKDPNDLTVPGRFWEKIKDEYPLKEELHEFEMGIEMKAKDFQQQVRKRMLGMEYKSKDKKELLRVAPNQLSVHRLPPYPSWESFSPVVKRAYQIFQELVQPESLERVGLRYIDRVEIPSKDFGLKEYFRIYPETPEGGLTDCAHFLMQMEFPFNENRDVLRVMMFNQGVASKNYTAILLDWDYFLVKPEQVEMTKVWEWVEEAHEHILGAFEQSLTDSCRKLFE